MRSALEKGAPVEVEPGSRTLADGVGVRRVCQRTLEIATGVKIKVQKHALGAVLPKGTYKSA